MPRATTAACEVMPPRVVRMPSAACMPWMSSGEVSTRTRMTFLPSALSFVASSELNTISPEAAPGEAGRPGRDHVALGLGIDGRMQQLVERAGLDPRHRLVLRDQLLVGKLDRDAERRLRGALAVARLQHPELALLDRELHVLHVAVVLLERAVDARQLLERLRHRAFHRRLVGAGLLPRDLGDLLRRADAGDDILALGVDQELAIEPLLAGRRIAGERNAGRRGVAHVAEHHGLHVDRGAPAFRDGVQAAIGDGARVHPRAEHRADRAPELGARVLRERLALLLAHALLVARDHVDPVVGGQFGVERVARARLVVLQNVLEVVMLDVEHDVGIHLDEAAVGIIGEAPVAGLAAPAPRRSRR